jgi:hypothetical protein
MNELYWITRFDTVHTLGVIITVVSLIIFIICWMVSISTDDWTGEDSCTESQKQQLRKGANYTIVSFIFGLLLWVFIPTKNEALMIWGIGGTIDYLQANPTAKQLPDKCINALDKWVDTWTVEEKKEKKKKEEED